MTTDESTRCVGVVGACETATGTVYCGCSNASANMSGKLLYMSPVEPEGCYEGLDDLVYLGDAKHYTGPSLDAAMLGGLAYSVSGPNFLYSETTDLAAAGLAWVC